MPDNYVSYNAQTPSENEKVQARQNIGAMGLNSFDLYMNGAVPRPPVPPFFTQRIPNIVPGYTEFELINGLNHALLIEQTAKQNTDLLLKENLEKETADRIQADNQLQENITAEATARENADNQLQQNITAEETARENADNQLQTKINAINAQGNVRYDVVQNLTDEQKEQARANIGAGTGGGTAAGAVLYDQAQSLTEEQKAQARTNIGAGTGGSADGAVLYDQEQSLNDYQKLTARKNIGAISGQYRDNSGTHPMNISSSNNSNNNFNITIGGFSIRRSLTDNVSLGKLQNFSESEGWAIFEKVYGIAPTDKNCYNLLLGKLFLTINGEPTFTYPNNDLTTFANSTGANAGNAVRRFFSGTLNITGAANVVTNCNVLEMYFLPFDTTASAGSSGSLKYKIVLEVTGVSDGSTHQVGDIITLYNKLWDNSYESVNGTVNA